MVPQEFKKLWGLDTIEPIALLLGKSKDVVYRWTSNTQRLPPQEILLLLDFINNLWESWEDERLKYPPHYRFFYEQNTRNRTAETNTKYSETLQTPLAKRSESNASVLTEFVKTWNEKPETVALLLPDNNIDSVRAWFSDNPVVQPPIEAVQLLNAIHVLWWKWERERLYFPPHFRSLYENNVTERIVKAQIS